MVSTRYSDYPRELERKESTIRTVSNALTFAESECAKYRARAGELENENRRLKLDLEEAQMGAVYVIATRSSHTSGHGESAETMELVSKDPYNCADLHPAFTCSEDAKNYLKTLPWNYRYTVAEIKVTDAARQQTG